MKRTRLPLAAVVAVLLAASAARAQSDQVFGEGAPARGEVLSMTKAEVVIKTRTIERSYATNEIKKITFEGDPQELRRARDHTIVGRYEDAYTELRKLGAAKIERDYIKQDIAFYTAYAAGKVSLAGGGDKAAAVKALRDFKTANPESYHYYPAVELLGDLAIALAAYAPATAFYRELEQSPWPETQMRGAVLVARTLQAEGKFGEALQSYERVANGKLDTAEANRQKLFGRVGMAACLAETGKSDEGVKLLEDIIARSDPQDVQLFARCYNALGDCYRKSGKSKEALRAYLHTDILFSADGESHAEALYHLSVLWGELKKSDRAVSARSLLKSRYAGSSWAKKSS